MKRGKKLFAILLSLAMAVSMIPAFTITAGAAEPVTCTGYWCTDGNGYIYSVKLNGKPLEQAGSIGGLVPGQTATLTVETINVHYLAYKAYTNPDGPNPGGYQLEGDKAISSGTIIIPEGDFIIGIETLTVQYQVDYYKKKYGEKFGTYFYDYDTQVTVKDLNAFGNVPAKPGYEFAGWIDNEGQTYAAGSTFTAKKKYFFNGKELYVQWKQKAPTHTVNANAINVRQGPGTDQIRIGGLSAGKEVVVVETQDGWSRIIYGTDYGWVDSRYLEVIPYYKKKNPFVDVFESDFYYAAVLWAYYADPQVTNGIDATHFGPMNTVTRAQAVTFLWRSEGCPEPSVIYNPFDDVPRDQYYFKAVLWAVEKGITKGITATKFDPDGTLSTQHIITFLYRTKNPGKDGWSGEAAKWAADINGKPFGVDIPVNNGTLCPRCDVVVFIHRTGFSG